VIVTEPAPAEAPPAETVEQAAPAEKPARKRRSKKAEAALAEAEAESAAPEPEPAPMPAANNDAAEAEEPGEPRRSGWWQRTFG
jgi:ribonuclease E